MHMFGFSGYYQQFSEAAVSVYILTGSGRAPFVPCLLQYLLLHFICFSHSGEWVVKYHCIFNMISLLNNGDEHIFVCLLVTQFISSAFLLSTSCNVIQFSSPQFSKTVI